MSPLAGAALLAAEGGSISAGPLGLLVVLLMVIATVLLIRNMNARLRRLPDRFPDDAGSRTGNVAADEPEERDRS